MSTKNKLKRFAENLDLPNVFENLDYHNPVLYRAYKQQIDLKGKWNSDYFKNDFPITLELACGGGEYCLGLSTLFPERNYIGVDIKGARIWKGAKKAYLENNGRIAFVRTKIQLIPHFFEAGEINEIWITFPDPFLKYKNAMKRLTSPYFLNTYKNVLATNANIHLKTDDESLYNFTLKVLEADKQFELIINSDDIYHADLKIDELDLKTHYEAMHLAVGKRIKYIKFKFKG